MTATERALRAAHRWGHLTALELERKLDQLRPSSTTWLVTLRARQRDGTDLYRSERVTARDEADARDTAEALMTDTHADWYVVRVARR